MVENAQKTTSAIPVRFPEWLKNRVNEDETVLQFKKKLKNYHLHTVCQAAKCPNLSECFHKQTATFMILGDICTRQCKFCGVTKGKPAPLDPGEPARIGEIVKVLRLKHVVITSVTRDDLPDGGSHQFSETVKCIKKESPGVTVETLIPDFKGNEKSIETVLNSGVDVLNHNIETVPRLYSFIRPEANFERSLHVLKLTRLFKANIIIKSGLMVGLGETWHEILAVFQNLLEAHCDALTIGQYLAPSRTSPPVHEYIHPKVFESYRKTALRMGFRWVQSGPRIRSSFCAENMMTKYKGVIL